MDLPPFFPGREQGRWNISRCQYSESPGAILPDPWPKDRHAKRRLTSRQFLARYEEILKKDGQIEFKTDNRDLFDFSLEEVKEAGWKLELCTFDLHHSEYLEGNVMTEYEEKFVKKGNPICKMVIRR